MNQVKITDLFYYINDGTHDTPIYTNVGIPFYSVEDITSNFNCKTKYISEQLSNKLNKRCNPEYGDILLTRIGTIGEVYLIDYIHPSSIYVSLALLKPYKNIETKYIYTYMKSSLFKKNIYTHSLQKATPIKINTQEIKNLYIPFVGNESTRNTIVNIMESVDNMIYSLKRNRDKMNNMLYGTLSKHFCSNKVKPCLLEDLMMLKKGKQFNGDKLTTDGIYKMYNGGASYSGLLNDWNTQKDTIIISEGGNSCGFVNYIRENFWAGGHCYYAIPNKKCNKKYLYYVLKYCQEKIMKLRVGSGLPNIQKLSLIHI